MIATGRCGRRTKRGTACTNFVLAGWNVGPGIAVPPSCGLHLTASEDERWQAAVAAERERRRQDEARWRASEPACWSWTDMPDPATWTLSADLLAVLPDLASDAEYCGLAMLRDWQDGRCAICNGCGFDLVKDHDHLTGLVRGYLCSSCNTREGFARGVDPFSRYRERNPASMLGLRIRYWDAFRREYAEPPPERPAADDWTDNAVSGLL